MIVQVATACLGSLGFCILFHMRIPRLAPAALGGGLTWIVYLLCEPMFVSVFVPNLAAALFAAAYAELMARTQKAPTVIFFIAAAVPLIPGGGLFYTMESAVAGDQAAFVQYGVPTALCAGAIAFGLLLFTACMQVATYLFRREKPGN